MILAAGLGTRLRPLSALCAKPAMPVRGVPVIAYTLALLARHGVTEVVINLHHLPDSVRDAVDRHRPATLSVRFAHEAELLGTGGGMKAVAEFLRESDPSITLAGDMLLDVDLTAAVARHRARRDAYTLLLRDDDPRAGEFGTIGVDRENCIRRIGTRFDLGGEVEAALFTGVRIAAARAFTDFPEADTFEDLADWQAPLLRHGARDIRADRLRPDACAWHPVGTPREYLDANLEPPRLSYTQDLRALGARFGDRERIVIAADAEVPATAVLERVVVWPGERVPADLDARDGVFAGGAFHPCPPRRERTGTERHRPEQEGGKLPADPSSGGRA